jgi:hypothetical protein
MCEQKGHRFKRRLVLVSAASPWLARLSSRKGDNAHLPEFPKSASLQRGYRGVWQVRKSVASGFFLIIIASVISRRFENTTHLPSKWQHQIHFIDVRFLILDSQDQERHLKSWTTPDRDPAFSAIALA